MIDLLGFAGSALIVASSTMKSMVRLRLVAMAGALMFVAYGIGLDAWPVVVANTATITINIVRLVGLRAAERRKSGGREGQLVGFARPTEHQMAG